MTKSENVTASAESGDAITAGASPRPWRVEGPFPGQRETKRQHNFRDYANVLDRNGIYIAQNLPPETAALIVEAVNEHDSLAADEARYRSHNVVLRDIVRRLYQMCCEDWVHTNAEGRDLLREARAAIGEGA